MFLAGAEQKLCACYKERQEFHKVLDLKDAGLVVYCHTTCREGQVTQGELVGSAITSSQDVRVILHNTKDVKITPSEIIPALEKNDISCPRCRKLFEHAQKLLQNVKSVDKQNAMGVCDQCLRKAQSKKTCDLCAETVKKFLSSQDERKEKMKRYLKLWLSEMRYIVKNVVTEKNKEEKTRAHSELNIDRLFLSSPKASRQPKVKEMFHSELHNSDSNLYATFHDQEEKERKLQKSVIFNQTVEPFPATAYEKGITDTYRQSPSLVESNITLDRPPKDLQDSITQTERHAQKQIIHEIPKIAPWEQEAQEKQDESSIEKEVTIKLNRDPSTRGITRRKRHIPESDSKSTYHKDLELPKRRKKIESTTDIKGSKRKDMVAIEFEHPYSEQYKHEKDEYSKERALDTKSLPKTLKRLDDGHLTDDEIKLQRKVPKLSHETEKSGKNLAIKTSIKRKKPKFEEDSLENILQKQFSYFFPKSMEKEAKKPPKIEVPSSELIRATYEKIRLQAEEEKKRHEQERQRKLEEKEKKRLEKEEKKRLAEVNAKEAQEQKKHIEVQKRLSDEELMKKPAEEAMSEAAKKNTEDTDIKESLKKEFRSKYDQKDKKGDDYKKDFKQEVDVKSTAVKEQEKKIKVKSELKDKSDLRDKIEKTDKTQKEIKSKPESKAKSATKEIIEEKEKTKIEPSGAKEKIEGKHKAKKDLKAESEPKSKRDKIEEMDKTKKDFKAKSEPKGKPDTKDKVEELDKTKKDLKGKLETKGKPDTKDKVEELDKTKKDLKGKLETKGKPDTKDKVEEIDKTKKDLKGKLEPKGKIDTKDKVEEKDKVQKDKSKLEPKAKPPTKEKDEEKDKVQKEKSKLESKTKPPTKDKHEEIEKAKKDKTKPEPTVKPGLKDKDQEKETKAKTESKVKPESIGKSDLKNKDQEIEKIKKDGTVKSETKRKPEEVDKTESSKKDKARAEQKVKTDLKERVEETEPAKRDKDKTDLKGKIEERGQLEKRDKDKAGQKAKTDLKEKIEETESGKRDKAKAEQKAKTDLKEKIEETEAAKRNKAKAEQKTKTDLKEKVQGTESAKTDKDNTEQKTKPDLKEKVEGTESAKTDKGKAEQKTKPNVKEKVEGTESAKTDKVKAEQKTKPNLNEKVKGTESVKKDQANAEQKAKPDLKEKVEETESAKRDKAKAEQKAKTDLKEKFEGTESAKKDKANAEQKAKPDLKEKVEEMESAKRDKTKIEQKAKPDLKEKVEATEAAKVDRNKAQQKVKPDLKEKGDEMDSAKRNKAKSDQKTKADLSDQSELIKKNLTPKSEPRGKSEVKKNMELSEAAKKDLRSKSEPRLKIGAKHTIDEEHEKTLNEFMTKSSQKDKTYKDVVEKDSKLKLSVKDKDVVKSQKDKQDRGEEAKKDREEKARSKQAEQLQKEKETTSKKKLDFQGEFAPSDKRAKEVSKDKSPSSTSKEGTLKEKSIDFKAMKLDKGESLEPSVSVRTASTDKTKDISAKTKEKPSKEQDKRSKFSEELKEKEKRIDFKGINIDKGELSEPVSKASSSKDKEKEDKAKEKSSKAQDKSSKISKELKEDDKTDSVQKGKGETEEALFKKLQAEALKEKELLSKQKKQEDADRQKTREIAEKQAKETERATFQIKEAKPTPKPEPPRPPQRPLKLEPKRVDEPALEVKKNQVQMHNSSVDDLILRLVTTRQTTVDRKTREKPYNIDPAMIRAHRCNHDISLNESCELCKNSELEIDVDTFENQAKINTDMEIIIGEKLYKYTNPLFEKPEKKEVVPMFFKSMYDLEPVPFTPETVPSISSVIHEPTKKHIKDAKGADTEPAKGIIRYALSDRTFIDKGWTMLPTEKVVRKMNVYRMRPAHPEFDWFEHNKNKRLMTYDSGEKLAEFDDNGRGRWYYRNGRLALDYYDAEETNAQQRFVIYSSGEPDERGRSHPITILATFDYLGNGIVFDHAGKIRLKYNQTEGVVLDRGIGPVSHWKWHTLNDPPVLQQVMIDTQMAHKDPKIIKLGTAADNKIRPDNEEMLAIEFDNFIKEKSKKLSQKFKPFQIKMKALKINEHFSLKVLDQATVYLIFRDGSTNLKLNIGMILDHQEIVDTDTAEVGEVSNNLERFPARTDSLAGLQRSVAYAQRYERNRTERERRLRPPEPCGSADQLTAAASHPLRLPLRTVPTGSTSSATNCRCRKPTNNLYYNTRLL